MNLYATTLLLLSALAASVLAADPGQVIHYDEVPAGTPAVLCADQSDNRIRLFDPLPAGDAKPTLWCYPRDDQKALRYRPTDAKRVEIDGVVHVLAAYHGRVRLVRFSDQKLIKDFPSYSSCHSAELLPDGAIVSANSNHGMLRLHRSADDFVDLELPYAHGVTWDKARQCLWALGDCLYLFDYSDGALSLVDKIELPLSPTGHDIFPLRDEAKLLVSNNDALFLFDIATQQFETVSELKFTKSASQHIDGSLWVSEPKKIAGAEDWQSDSFIVVRPAAAAIRYTREGSRFYKARWWQDVKFSY